MTAPRRLAELLAGVADEHEASGERDDDAFNWRQTMRAIDHCAADVVLGDFDHSTTCESIKKGSGADAALLAGLAS